MDVIVGSDLVYAGAPLYDLYQTIVRLLSKFECLLRIKWKILFDHSKQSNVYRGVPQNYALRITI